jgi:hypothetical protein
MDRVTAAPLPTRMTPRIRARVAPSRRSALRTVFDSRNVTAGFAPA